MTKLRLVTLAALILLALNLFLLLGRAGTPPVRHQRPRDFIIGQLNFKPEQIARYDSLIQQHRSAVRSQEQALIEMRTRLYANLKSEAPVQDSLLQAACRLQMDLERVHYEHFARIRALCNPEQLPLFEQLIPRLPALFLPPPPPPGKQ